MATLGSRDGYFRNYIFAVCVIAAGWMLQGGWFSPGSPIAPEWTGKAPFRVLVTVPPTPIEGRESDNGVARFAVNFPSLLKHLRVTGEVDLASLQVQKYDPATGRPESFASLETRLGPYDRPCRFDDDVLPLDYPDRVGAASSVESGRGPVILRKRGGRLFNREMDNKAGQVVWVHTQKSNAPSHYAIYFDVKSSRAETGPSPAPWIGDVDVLRAPEGQPLGGLAHFTLAVGDFDGDGLFDLFGGAEKGDLMWFKNHGAPGKPKFIGCRMLTDEEGPIDCGWYSAPFLYDWDADGLPDLLAGTNNNAILWWKNVGKPTDPRLSFRGHVQSDGARLQVPESPVPEDTRDVFKRDYYNQPWVGDWDGDGLPDIVTGGYTTGRIFLFRSTGRDSKGVPLLKYVGPLHAGGQPIDTIWAAAPTAGDFDGDGKLELISGTWKWTGIHDESIQVDFLQYYRNVGDPKAPALRRQPFPKAGDFPPGNIARASVVDWNNDGLQDLLVSDNSGSVHLALNEGTGEAPRWRFQPDGLTIPWGFVRAHIRMLSGMNGKSVFLAQGTPIQHQVDRSGTGLHGFEGSPYLPRVTSLGTILAEGKPIIPAGLGYGDLEYFNVLVDWDRDGRLDVLSGSQGGNIFFHRNQGQPGGYVFDAGIKLKLTTGEDLKVGPPVYSDPKDITNFADLQGARVTMVPADFDGDGIDDLVVSETYKNIWVFRNTRVGGTDTLAPGVKVGQRLPGGAADPGFDVIDWNRDGLPDLIHGLPLDKPGSIYINRSTPGKPAFDPPVQPLNLPFVFWGPVFRPVDWNSDGDQDFLINSEFYLFWAEGSFVRDGYREAALVRPERREPETRRPVSRVR
jgi:hypothetical protein